MKDSGSLRNLDTTEKEKDLGIHVGKDLKSQEQCTQAARKAQAVLGMVKRHFTQMDKEDFMVIYKAYIRPHLEYCVQAWSPHFIKDIDCLEQIQRRATKLVKGLKKWTYEDRLKHLGLQSLKKWRLCGDLIEVYKILNGKERVDTAKFFQLASDTHGLRGHSQKLFKRRCRTTVRKTFFSNRIIDE